MDNSKDLRLAVLIDADNIPHRLIGGILEEIARYGSPAFMPWRVLKKRLKDEGNETVTNCNALKMEAPDGKMRMTDVATSPWYVS